jgi:hypothetical protein
VIAWPNQLGTHHHQHQQAAYMAIGVQNGAQQINSATPDSGIDSGSPPSVSSYTPPMVSPYTTQVSYLKSFTHQGKSK